MVVDRGGLRYPIEIVDKFTTNAQRFRDEIRKSRQEFNKFAAESKKLNTTVAQNQTQSARGIRESRAIEAAATKERLAGLNEGIKKQREVERLRARANKDRRLEANRIAAAETKAGAARDKANKQAARSAQRAANAQARLRRNVNQTESAASRLLFTFRRLVGVLALFTVARQVSAGFAGLVRSGFQFNQTVEQSRLGIAGILVAVGDVTNQQGELVKGAEAYNVALGLAADQQKKLQVDALRTTATFEELLNVFQIATGPGLAAGLQLDQVREISVLVSQAASAIDLPQNQLSEEIRALLTGNIRQTTTRIAQVLTLTPEDIRNATQQGRLFELLQNRLSGFALAAEKTANTVGGLAQRIVGALQVVAGEAAIQGFESLRVALEGVFNNLLLIERNADGVITSLSPSPQAVAIFQSLFDAIDAIIQRATQVGGALGFDGLTDATIAFASALETVGVLLVDVIAGAIQGFGTLRNILEPVVDAITEVGEVLSSVLGASTTDSLVQKFTQLLTVVISLQIITGLVGKTFGNLLNVIPRLVGGIASAAAAMFSLDTTSKSWLATSKAGAAVWRSIQAVMLRMVAALGAVVLGFEQIFQLITGLDLTLKDTLDIIVLSFKVAWETVKRQGEIIFRTFANSLIGIFTDPIATIALRPLLGVSAALKSIGIISEDTRVAIEDAVSGLEQALQSRSDEGTQFFNTDQQKADLQEYLQEVEGQFEELRAAIAARGVPGEGFVPGFVPPITGAEASCPRSLELRLLVEVTSPPRPRKSLTKSVEASL
jgi:hypothetical protein